MSLILALARQRQADLYDSNLVYKEIYRTAKAATQRYPVLKSQEKLKKKKDSYASGFLLPTNSTGNTYRWHIFHVINVYM